MGGSNRRPFPVHPGAKGRRVLLEMLSNPKVQAVLAVAAVMIVSFVGYQVVMRLRPSTSKADTNPADAMANFEEMKLQGDIDEGELRQIKTVLGKQQQSTSND